MPGYTAGDGTGPVGGADAAASVDAIASATHGDPFGVLGPHRQTLGGSDVLVVRVCQPAATRVEIVRADGRATGMRRCHPAGVYEAVFDDPERFPYRLRITYPDGHHVTVHDPYAYDRILSDYDLYLLAEGTHSKVFEKLGARHRTIAGVGGFHFAVWAPTADRVSVVGDFNGWDGRIHPMRNLLPNGVWEIFVPDLGEGERYKYEIRTRWGTVHEKTDPCGFFFEQPPGLAAITRNLGRHRWRDADWMTHRGERHGRLDRPMAVYEAHLGSWARVPEAADRFLTYEELAERLVPYVRDLGYTHIQLLPVMEHPFLGSWGYQVTGFFAPTSRYGPPESFKAFVDACHRNGLGVILDWVPGHFPKDAAGLARFDGTALYEHEDPRQGEQKDWGTLVFNYGRNEVRSFLLSNALFWLQEYHVDGLRVDAVASMLYLDYSREAGEWIPNEYGGNENIEAVEFLRQLNAVTHAEQPGSVMIAEESTAWPAVSRPTYLGGLGFTYKWNMGWMHDMLQYMGSDPVHRRWSQNHLTFSMLYAFSENFVLPLSHDEVVHGKRSLLDKMPGDEWQKFANLRALYGYMYGHPGKKLLFMGGEFGQWREWNHDRSLDWDLLERDPRHAALHAYVTDLNAIYRSRPSLHEVDFESVGFEWIDCNDHENSVVAFVRRARDPRDFTVVVANFTPVVREGYRLGIPEPGRYLELLNSDGARYGGSNVGDGGRVRSDAIEAHGQSHSISLTLPPLAILMLAPERSPDDGAP